MAVAGLIIGLVLAGCSDAAVRVQRSDPTPTEPTSTTGPTSTSLPGTSLPGTSPPDPVATADGLGDPLFPALGNPGIDVQHYDVRLAYDPALDAVEATVVISLLATLDLTEFTLDSTTPDVSAVTVNGTPAEFTEESPELRVTPAEPIASGESVEVSVTYSVDPAPIHSPVGLENGWFDTPGGSYVLNEPDGARNWLPSNDHPSDKATYRFEVTVPAGLTAVANGELMSHTTGEGVDTWVWEESRPMATYLIQLLTGDYELVEGTGPNGLPLLSAVLRSDLTTMQPYLDTIDEQIDFFDDLFGPYPLDAYGIAMSDSFPGLAMETQGRSLFSRDDFSSGSLDGYQQLLLSHELAHQWFGDAVSPAQWDDIWLNESFATYGEWLWLEHVGMGTVDSAAATALQNRRPGVTGDPTVGEMFGFNSYDGGAVVLHALRQTIGDEAFFTLLRRWVAENNGTSRSTADLIALANEVAGTDLTGFFDEWLFAANTPSSFPTR